MDIVIHYDLASEDDALALARRLFAHFDEAIASLTLVPVASDEFDLLLDGHLIHSRRASGRAPRLADLVSAVDLPSSAPRAAV
jgi:predicted Rdx family selenoprotein